MKLDNEDQRLFLLEVVKHATIPGNLLDLAYSVKLALLEAEVPQAAPVEGG